MGADEGEKEKEFQNGHGNQLTQERQNVTVQSGTIDMWTWSE